MKLMMTQRMRKWLEFMIDPEVNGLFDVGEMMA